MFISCVYKIFIQYLRRGFGSKVTSSFWASKESPITKLEKKIYLIPTVPKLTYHLLLLWIFEEKDSGVQSCEQNLEVDMLKLFQTQRKSYFHFQTAAQGRLGKEIANKRELNKEEKIFVQFSLIVEG